MRFFTNDPQGDIDDCGNMVDHRKTDPAVEPVMRELAPLRHRLGALHFQAAAGWTLPGFTMPGISEGDLELATTAAVAILERSRYNVVSWEHHLDSDGHVWIPVIVCSACESDGQNCRDHRTGRPLIDPAVGKPKVAIFDFRSGPPAETATAAAEAPEADEDLLDDVETLWSIQERWILTGGLEVTREIGAAEYKLHAGDLMEYATSAELHLTELMRKKGTCLRIITTDGRVFVAPGERVLGVYVELLTPYGDVVQHLEPGYAKPGGDPEPGS